MRSVASANATMMARGWSKTLRRRQCGTRRRPRNGTPLRLKRLAASHTSKTVAKLHVTEHK